VYFHEKKNPKTTTNKQHLFSFFKFSLILPLLDGIKKKLFCSMQLFKKPEKNTTNSAKIVIETSGLFLYCFFSSNHRPPCIKNHPNLEDVFFLSEKKYSYYY